MDPFIPIQINKQHLAIRWIEAFLFLIKLPIFLLLTLEIIITNDCFFRQIQSLSLHNTFHKFIRVLTLLHNFCCGRMILLVLGYFKYKSLFSSESGEFKIINLQSYCFYCSRSSPVDIFVLITYFSPSFTHISIPREKQLNGKIISYLRAITDSFFLKRCSFNNFIDGKDLLELMNQIRRHRTGPLIVFWEGGITNGYNLLKIDLPLQRQIELINNYAKKNMRGEYSQKNPQALLSIQHDDRMNLIGNGPVKMLIKILTNSFSYLDMFFHKLPMYGTIPFADEIKTFVENKLQRGISDQNWKDYQKQISKF